MQLYLQMVKHAHSQRQLHPNVAAETQAAEADEEEKEIEP